MCGRGLTENDNRMISLTMVNSTPMFLNQVKLINLSVYRGDWLKGKRHGKGNIVWKDGSSYEGDWQ